MKLYSVLLSFLGVCFAQPCLAEDSLVYYCVVSEPMGPRAATLSSSDSRLSEGKFVLNYLPARVFAYQDFPKNRNPSYRVPELQTSFFRDSGTFKSFRYSNDSGPFSFGARGVGNLLESIMWKRGFNRSEEKDIDTALDLLGRAIVESSQAPPSGLYISVANALRLQTIQVFGVGRSLRGVAVDSAFGSSDKSDRFVRPWSTETTYFTCERF